MCRCLDHEQKRYCRRTAYLVKPQKDVGLVGAQLSANQHITFGVQNAFRVGVPYINFIGPDDVAFDGYHGKQAIEVLDFFRFVVRCEERP